MGKSRPVEPSTPLMFKNFRISIPIQKMQSQFLAKSVSIYNKKFMYSLFLVFNIH